MDLRITETNSADDNAGRAFGLEGNLYLPVLFALVGGILGCGVGLLILHAPLLPTVIVASAPAVGVALWMALLRHGRPPGYDRDLVETWFGCGDFAPPREEDSQ